MSTRSTLEICYSNIYAFLYFSLLTQPITLKAFLVLFKHYFLWDCSLIFPQRYGLKSYSSREIRTELMDHYEHLMTERMKYTWISSANKAGAAEPIEMFGGYVPIFFFLMSERKKNSKDQGGCQSNHFSKEALSWNDTAVYPYEHQMTLLIGSCCFFFPDKFS